MAPRDKHHPDGVLFLCGSSLIFALPRPVYIYKHWNYLYFVTHNVLFLTVLCLYFLKLFSILMFVLQIVVKGMCLFFGIVYLYHAVFLPRGILLNQARVGRGLLKFLLACSEIQVVLN